MATIGHAPKTIDIDCQYRLPVSIVFTSDGREILCAERPSNSQSGGRIRRYPIHGENPNERANVLVDGIDGLGCAAMSKDGQWIVYIAGNKAVVRNTTTNEGPEIDEYQARIRAIDVSPDSTRFASGSEDKTVQIFSLTTGKRVLGPLQHNDSVVGVKFVPDGERLVTAAHRDPIRIWDTNTGNIITQTREPFYFHTPNVADLTQAQTYTFIGSSNRGACVVTPANGLIIPQFPTQEYYGTQSGPLSKDVSYSSLATNGRFIAYSMGKSLMFWDPSSSEQIGSTIELHDSIVSIALSPDDNYLACGRADMKITVYALRDILPLDLIFDSHSRLPLMNISHDTFKAWVDCNFYEAQNSILYQSASYSDCNQYNYHAFALRALVRTRMNQWDMALLDANQSLSVQSSIIGYIAKAVALVGQNEHEHAFEAFDAAFCKCTPDETRFLFLIRAILLFLSGKRKYAITRVNDLIAVADDSEKYNCLQVLANMYLMQGDAENAMQSFERAYSLSFCRQGFHLVTILLIFGRSFEEYEIKVHRPLRGTIVG